MGGRETLHDPGEDDVRSGATAVFGAVVPEAGGDLGAERGGPLEDHPVAGFEDTPGALPELTEPFTRPAVLVQSVSPPLHFGTHALFVDVGYVYAAMGLLVAGSAERRAFRVDAEQLITGLIDEARRVFPEGRLLRVYWYDGARERVHTVEQRQIAELPDVKVRLGNLNAHNQQKGVDSLIRSDLESLARNHAIDDAVVISGDEDLVSAVEAAQSYGVRVHLWGVEPAYGTNQADPLVWEADVTRMLHREFCETCVTPVMLPPSHAGALAVQPGGPPTADQAWHIGQEIAKRWLVVRGRENLADLMPGPMLPQAIDRGLLVDAESVLQYSLRPHEDLRRALRNGFWDRLNQEFGLPGTELTEG
ncbi:MULTISPECIES: NYN domain-containing protein [Streptomycetaceae]|uniref:NYN domain-containing protein n=1 Tax=Embleya scabrispora TaxID=159449 RepID=UPI00036DB195|nr:NYN domain-containing protein [Streptomyces sp. SID5474]